ncbi:MAG: hypothetical protein HZB68_00040, partial [Candidatus Aenigmarchaeota archaeon]|nr:hypothetical protein [Candidatus Aenigmarchaeota archaeon]
MNNYLKVLAVILAVLAIAGVMRIQTNNVSAKIISGEGIQVSINPERPKIS